jgi:hypothetical protein
MRRWSHSPTRRASRDPGSVVDTDWLVVRFACCARNARSARRRAEHVASGSLVVFGAALALPTENLNHL